jgi:hypothetical protein
MAQRNARESRHSVGNGVEVLVIASFAGIKNDQFSRAPPTSRQWNTMFDPQYDLISVCTRWDELDFVGDAAEEDA